MASYDNRRIKTPRIQYGSESRDPRSRAAYTRDPDATPYRSPRRTGGRRVGLVILVVVLVLVACAGVYGALFYRSAMSVREDAHTVIDEGETLQDQVKSFDFEGAQTTAVEMANLADGMQSEVSSPLWDIAVGLPVIGDDMQKVRDLAFVLVDLCDDAVLPMTNSLSGLSLQALIGEDGTINVGMISTISSVLNETVPVFQRCAQSVDDMGEARLEQVNSPLAKARDKLDSLSERVAKAAELTSALPNLLGANGTRTYLLIAQNNSEIRSTGGFPGTRGLITVDNGHVTVGDFDSVGTHFDESEPLGLTEEEWNVFVTIMETNAHVAPGDVNVTPSFPRAAQLMEEAWERQQGVAVDGVVAFDPVFLQSLLALTGGITTSNGTVVDGTNAAQVLLNQTYFLDSELQDPFFNEVAELAFSHVMSSLGTCSISDLITTVEAGIDQHRALMYMNDETEEQAMVALGCDGEISEDETAPVVGFYLYDKTGSKLDWYLDFRTQVGDRVTNADGSTSYNVTTTLYNTTTLEQMLELPQYITGLTPEVHSYSMITAYIILAPAGGSITNLTVTADEVNWQQEVSLYGHDAWVGWVNIRPSQTGTFTYTVTTSPNATEELQVWMTPTGQTFA